MEQLVLPIRKCIRCEKTWIPRKLDIKNCPKCNSSLWNKPRVRKPYNYKKK